MKAILLVMLAWFPAISWCQEGFEGEAEIRAVINQLFDGMRSGDSTLVRAVFHEDAQAYTSYKKDDAFHLHEGSIDDFVKAVGTPHDEIWDERISNMVIQVDDGLAHVWMDYSFYLDEEFSHKGVNSMLLANAEGKWKIINIADTRKRN